LLRVRSLVNQLKRIGQSKIWFRSASGQNRTTRRSNNGPPAITETAFVRTVVSFDQRICMLERGKEWIPGSFPDTFANVFGGARANLNGPTRGQVTKPLGLFNLMMNDEVNVLTGNGLGGGSLINASIALRPHREVFEQSRWPLALRNVEVLGPYYDAMARSMSLSRTPFDQTPKVRLRRLAAARLSNNPNFFDRSNLSVMYDHRYLDQSMRNPQGMIQRACTLCGDCINGCNIGAKNSLQYNYLPVAKHNGTEMYTQVEVTSIEKKDGFYRVNMVYIDDQYGRITPAPGFYWTRKTNNFNFQKHWDRVGLATETQWGSLLVFRQARTSVAMEPTLPTDRESVRPFRLH